jgi:hypothetical protein
MLSILRSKELTKVWFFIHMHVSLNIYFIPDDDISLSFFPVCISLAQSKFSPFGTAYVFVLMP